MRRTARKVAGWAGLVMGAGALAAFGVPGTPAIGEAAAGTPAAAAAVPAPGRPAAARAAVADTAPPSGAADGARAAADGVAGSILEVEEGEATYYADALEGNRTASGERLDQSELVAAHRTYPFGTRLRVTNLGNGRDVEVRVIDRGPFARGHRAKAVLDVSKAAARRLDFLRAGRVLVRVEVLKWGGTRGAGG